MAFWSFDSVDLDRTAIVQSDGGVVTYADLRTLADEWSCRLTAASGTTRPMIALELPTTVDAIAAYLGALRAGLPVLVGAPKQFADDSMLTMAWQPAIRVIERGGVLIIATDAAKQTSAAATPHPELALLLSTSGTTGDPKLVRLSHTNIASNASAIAEYLRLDGDDRAATTLPLFYSYGLSVLNSHLAVGASLMLTARSVTEAAFWDEFRDNHATSLALIPHQFDLLAAGDFAAQNLPSLRYITQAGGRLPEARVRQFADLGQHAGWELFVMYGQTEAAPRISYVPPASLREAADTIGQAIPGGRLWIAGRDGEEITAPGVAGELVFEGPNVMMGYAHKPEDLALESEEPVLHTGDIAERTESGFFRIVGRSKRFVKLYGLRVSLDQVEMLLAARDIAAHAISIDDRLVVLHLHAHQGEVAAALIADAYDLPTLAIHVVHLETVPLLPSGKPDGQAMRRFAGDALDQRDQAGAAGGTDIGSLLMEATRRRTIRPEDSFASLGGDSLSYIQVQIGLEERLGHVPDGWEDLTLAALQALASSNAPARRTSEVGIDQLLRVAALCLVIAEHASDYPLNGGPWILLTLMGYSAARFQFGMVKQGRALRLAWQMLYPMIPIYLAIISVYSAFRHTVPMVFYILTANYAHTEHSLLTAYWFVSLYAQIVSLIFLLAITPPLRRKVADRPWECAAAALAVLLAVAIATGRNGSYTDANAIHHGRITYVAIHGLLECLPMFLIGWMISRMKTLSQTLLTGLLALFVIVLFARLHPPREAVVLLALCYVLVTAAPPLQLPMKLARGVQMAASATLFVYLFHEVIVFVLQKAHLTQVWTIGLSIPIAFGAAIWTKTGFGKIERRILDADVWAKIRRSTWSVREFERQSDTASA